MKKYHQEQEDMKTYVLTLSQVFPVTHHRKGEQTDFRTKFLSGQYAKEAGTLGIGVDEKRKLHTIRANYPLWRERFNQIARGEACLSIRQWTGKPYCSKQIEIARLTAEDGIGVERLVFTKGHELGEWAVHNDEDWCKHVKPERLAMNDGLSLKDWTEWFNNPAYDKSQPFAVIQFTNFRYMH